MNSAAVEIGLANFVIVVTWFSLARVYWQEVWTRRPVPRMTLLSFAMAISASVLYGTATAFSVAPQELHSKPTTLWLWLYLINDLAGFACVALFAHMSWYYGVKGERPRVRWIVANYAGAVWMGAGAIFARIWFPDPDPEGFMHTVYPLYTWTYMVAVFALTMRRVASLARGGSWRAGAIEFARRTDVLVMGGTLAVMAIVFVFLGSGGWEGNRARLNVLVVVVGILITVPFAVRHLGETLRGVLATLGVLMGIGFALWLGWHVWEAMPYPGGEALAALVGGSALLLVIGPWQDLVGRFVDWLVYRRTRDRLSDLQQTFHSLSPELGADECGRRALASLVRIMDLPGAAILYPDGRAVVERQFAAADLAERWPRLVRLEHKLAHPIFGGSLQALPFEVRESLIEANVSGIIPIHGSVRTWGHLVLTSDLVGTGLRLHEEGAVHTFADQLGMLLDGADLLDRVVGVERSLAHAEKLAAIGELAARVAHEIRNPVTAVRSLAQQLVREPGSPFVEEHQVILVELERVERQVKSLLRFARKEDFTLVSVDLGELVRGTVDDLREPLDAVGVSIELDVADGIECRADPDKIRQVLVNLIENARDALEESAERLVRVEAGPDEEGANASIRISDTGPGADPEILEEIFQPFFSKKQTGTGLGLAIARKTIDAHGGRIEARSTPGEGMTIEFSLPLVERSDSVVAAGSPV